MITCAFEMSSGDSPKRVAAAPERARFKPRRAFSASAGARHSDLGCDQYVVLFDFLDLRKRRLEVEQPRRFQLFKLAVNGFPGLVRELFRVVENPQARQRGSGRIETRRDRDRPRAHGACERAAPCLVYAQNEAAPAEILPVEVRKQNYLGGVGHII